MKHAQQQKLSDFNGLLWYWREIGAYVYILIHNRKSERTTVGYR